MRLHSTLDASEPERRGQLQPRAGLAGGDGRPLPRVSRGGRRDRAAGRSAAVRPRQRPRLPLSRRRGRGGDAQAPRAVRARVCTIATPMPPAGARDRAAARLQRGAADHREARHWPASSCSTTSCSSSRARWRWRSRGAGHRPRALLPPGRGRGSSVSSIVCYLTGLSHVDPIANELLIGRFLNEELTSLPDIDLDFPRDIREVLIPRVHERYGHDRSALVAAFPTYRARGAIRELGKALGLPPGEIERVARGSEGWDARDVGGDIENAESARSARRAPRRPLGLAGAAGRRGARAAAPPLPALGRDDRRHPAADRLLPDRAGGDGGPPDRPVGQGLLRRRRLPEDRPARAGDALGGRALRSS